MGSGVTLISRRRMWSYQTRFVARTLPSSRIEWTTSSCVGSSQARADADRALAAIEEHASKTGMQRNAAELVLDRTQTREQLDRSSNAMLRRTLEPLERHRIPAPREDVEDRRREIHPLHLGLAMR